MEVEDALCEYFRLKNEYESRLMDQKKRIIHNTRMSKREKTAAYRRLKPRCIHCGEHGGTRFKTTYFKGNDKTEPYREYTATCGSLTNPCGVNIKIQVGTTEQLSDILSSIETEMKQDKSTIIDDKNKLLFGYLDAEGAIQIFDDMKETINEYSALYEKFLQKYNEIVDNEEKKRDLDGLLIRSYTEIDAIKRCMQDMRAGNYQNEEYAKDAATIYVQKLLPLLHEVRDVKYNEVFVSHDDESGTCRLIQNKYSIENLSFSGFKNRVVSFRIDAASSKEPSAPPLVERERERERENPESGTMEPQYDATTGEVIWPTPEYNQLWARMPSKLKNALVGNQQWMTVFVSRCVEARAKKEPCRFIPPQQGLIIPPNVLTDGKYSFGVPIYTDAFNRLDAGTQKTYLSLYSKKPGGERDYNGLLNAMNDLVAKEVDFATGYF